MDWASEYDVIAAYAVLVGSAFYIFSKVLGFVSSQIRLLESGGAGLTDREHRFITLPAAAAHFVFAGLFGRTSGRFRDLFTWRSVSMAFLISLVANSVCIFLILTSVPDDVPAFDWMYLRTLGLSYMVFVIFGFAGDLISINTSRHAMFKIAVERQNFLRWILFDVFGIFVAYIVSLSLVITITIYCVVFNVDMNYFVQNGLFGNVIIPFFLFIFATSSMPLVFLVAALVAVFSITLPTVGMILLVILFFLVNLSYARLRSTRVVAVDTAANMIGMAGKTLLFVGSVLAALAVVYQIQGNS